MLVHRATYEELCTDFRWEIPARFNIGLACADRHPPDALALVAVASDGSRREFTFRELSALSNRCANALRGSASISATGSASSSRSRPAPLP